MRQSFIESECEGFKAYVKRYRKLSMAEKAAEKAFYESLWSLPLRTLISDGLTLSGCTVQLQSKHASKHEKGDAATNLSIALKGMVPLPSNLSIEMGDYCRLLGTMGESECVFFGELLYKGPKHLLLAINEQESKYDQKKDFAILHKYVWRLDKGYSTITFNRIAAALKTLNELPIEGASDPLKAVIASSLIQMHEKLPVISEITDSIQSMETQKDLMAKVVSLGQQGLPLNPSQLGAIEKSIQSRVLLLQGPPGTGKTSTAAHLVQTLSDIVSPKKGTLGVFAFNNVAADELMHRCMSIGLKCVRVGADGEEYDLDTVLRKKAKKLFDKVREIDTRLREISNEMKELNRTMSLLYDRKKKRLDRRDLAHVNVEIIDLNAEKDGLKEEMGGLIRIKNRVKHQIADTKKQILREYDAIFSTCIKAGHIDLEGMEFAAVVIDECTQAVEPSIVIPLLKLSEKLASSTPLRFARAILLGDQHQLPPMVRSMDGLSELDGFYKDPTVCLPKTLRLSMLERLILFKDHIGDFPSISSSLNFHRLKIQYRMHSSILEWSNKTFYDGDIQSGCTDEDRSLPFDPLDLFDFIQDPSLTVNSDFRFYFLNIDRVEIAQEERVHTSFRNKTTAFLVHKVVDKLVQYGVYGENVGVITPYSAQRRLLQHPSPSDGLAPLLCEVKTVDGFQGREKEVIILDTVRTNDNKSAGFLSDPKRLNVALTRARRLVVIIGSVRTLSSSDLWVSLIELCKERESLI